MLKVGGISFVKTKVEKLVAFAESLDTGTRGWCSSKCIEQVLDNNEQLSELLQRDAFNAKLGLALHKELIVGCDYAQ